jgi:hypothetical protein
MSAIGPKRTSLVALHMSAFEGKADMTFAGIRFRGRYWGQSGHALLHRTCLLMTQSGHSPRRFRFALLHGYGHPADTEIRRETNLPSAQCQHYAV